MKTLKTLSIIAIAIFGFSATSFGQSTATASTTATLITPIAIEKTTDMNFGTVGTSGTAGTIALDYANGVLPGGGATSISTSAIKTAVFHVTGANDESIGITIPTSPITLTATGGSANVTVSDFAVEGGTTQNLSSSGALDLKVKAILNLPASANAGVYSNATGLSVTVNYN